MLNIKGENNMSKNEVEQANLRSELWSLVHEVSKLDMEIARKLDVVISDLQEVQFRIGLDKGTEITKSNIAIANRETEKDKAYKLAHAFDDLKKEFPNLLKGEK